MLRTCIPAAIAAVILLAGPAAAEGYVRISDRDTFLGTVAGKELRYGMFGISLRVLPDGRIDGEAMGWGVTGTWEWRDGYFCREMDWSGTPIPANCQLVEATASGFASPWTAAQAALRPSRCASADRTG